MRRMLMLLPVCLILSTAQSLAQETTLDREASVFAVVTHKAGVAAKLAHNHLVVAKDYTLDGDFDPSNPAATRFRLEVASEALTVDDAALQAKWQDRILELEILDEAFGELKDSDRKKIRKSMLSKGQLNVEKYPSLSAEVLDIQRTKDGEFPFTVKLAVAIVGQTVNADLAGKMTEPADKQGEGFILEAYGQLLFSDFGIKPYSAMLGAVRNDDPFHIYVHLVFK